MTTAPAKLYGKNLSEYDELDVDQLLSQLSPEEISILAKEVDPDVSVRLYACPLPTIVTPCRFRRLNFFTLTMLVKKSGVHFLYPIPFNVLLLLTRVIGGFFFFFLMGKYAFAIYRERTCPPTVSQLFNILTFTRCVVFQDNLLPPSERCSYECNKEATGPLNRKKLIEHINKQALETPDLPEVKPYVAGTVRGKKVRTFFFFLLHLDYYSFYY